jgi:hypothetical protein
MKISQDSGKVAIIKKQSVFDMKYIVRWTAVNLKSCEVSFRKVEDFLTN